MLNSFIIDKSSPLKKEEANVKQKIKILPSKLDAIVVCLSAHLILLYKTYLFAKPPFNLLVIKIFHSSSLCFARESMLMSLVWFLLVVP